MIKRIEIYTTPGSRVFPGDGVRGSILFFLISRDFSRERGQLPNSLDTVLMHIICIIVLLEQVLTILCRN